MRVFCSLPVQAHKDHRVKQELQAKKESQDLLGRWDQKAIRVRQAQWDRPARKATRDLKVSQDLLGRWDQKVIRVRQAQWDRPARKATRDLKVSQDRPVPRASQDSAS